MLWSTMVLGLVSISVCDKFIEDETGHSSIHWKSEEQAVHLHVEHGGVTVDLDLFKAENAFTADTLIKLVQSTGVTTFKPDFFGALNFVDSIKKPTVVLSTMGILDSVDMKFDGVLKTPQGMLHLEADSALRVTNDGNVLGACNTGESDDGRRLVDKWTNCYTGDSTTKNFDIGIAIGSGLFAKKLNSDVAQATQWVNTVVSDANIIFENQVNIVLKVGEIYIQQDSNNAPSWDDPTCQLSTISDQLNEFRDWEAPTPRGLWHLFDDCFVGPSGTIGLATMKGGYPKGVICMTQKMSGIYFNTGLSWFSSNTWKTFAHEIGHNFGAQHSFEDGQGSTGGIMDYGDGKLDGEYQFNTNYRKDEICDSINAEIGSCSYFSEHVPFTGSTTTFTTTPCTGVYDVSSFQYTFTVNGVPTTYTNCNDVIAGVTYGDGYCKEYDVQNQLCEASCCAADPLNWGITTTTTTTPYVPCSSKTDATGWQITFGAIYTDCATLIADNPNWCADWEPQLGYCSRSCCVEPPTTTMLATTTAPTTLAPTTLATTTTPTTLAPTTLAPTTLATTTTPTTLAPTTLAPTTLATTTQTSTLATTLAPTTLATTITTTTLAPTTLATTTQISTFATTLAPTTLVTTAATESPTPAATTTQVQTSLESTTSTGSESTPTSTSEIVTQETSTSTGTTSASTSEIITSEISTSTASEGTGSSTSEVVSIETTTLEEATTSTVTAGTTTLAATPTQAQTSVEFTTSPGSESASTSTSKVLTTEISTSTASEITSASTSEVVSTETTTFHKTTTPTVSLVTTETSTPVATSQAQTSLESSTMTGSESTSEIVTTATTLATTTKMTSSTAEIGTTAGQLSYTCGNFNTGGCNSEYNNAVNNNNVAGFCIRCESEGGSNPLRNRCKKCCTKCGPSASVPTTTTRKMVKLLGRFRFRTRAKLSIEDAIAAIKNSLVKILGVDWWRILVKLARGGGRRLQEVQESIGDWDVNYEVLAPPEEAEAVQKSTEIVSENSTVFEETLKQELVFLGVNQTVLDDDFTIGAFTATEIVIEASTDAVAKSDEGGSYTAAIVGAAFGGFLVLVGLCLHFRYRRPREVVIEEETGIDTNDLEDPKAVQSQGQSVENKVGAPSDLRPDALDTATSYVISQDLFPMSRVGNINQEASEGIYNNGEPGTPIEPGTPMELQPREASTPRSPRDPFDAVDVPDEYVGDVNTEGVTEGFFV